MGYGHSGKTPKNIGKIGLLYLQINRYHAFGSNLIIFGLVYELDHSWYQPSSTGWFGDKASRFYRYFKGYYQSDHTLFSNKNYELL